MQIPIWWRAELKERYALTDDQLARIKVSAMDDESWESRLIFQLAWHRHRVIEIINARFGATGGDWPDLVLVPIFKSRRNKSYTVYKIEGAALLRSSEAVGYNVGEILLTRPCHSRCLHPAVELKKIIKGWYRDTDVASDKQTLSVLRYALL